MNAAKLMPSAFALSEQALNDLLRGMDEASSGSVSRNRRKHERYPHVCRDVQFRVVQPGGGTTDRIVACRDLSAGGMQVLYPGYLYSGSPVQVELQKHQGGFEVINGEVKNCRHIHATWHAVGIKFRETIFPQLFLSPELQKQASKAEPLKVDVTRLKGSVLLIDDQQMDRFLFIHMLKGSSLRVTEAATGDEAAALVSRSLAADPAKNDAFDLIVCDLNLGEASGETAIAQIRERGYKGPVLVMTAETAPDRLSAAMAAGSTSVFHKPYTSEKLHATIAEQLSEQCLVIDDPIYSPLASDPSSFQLVEKYVAQARLTLNDLHKWIAEENLQQVRAVCQRLKGTGSGYGFAALTDAAAAAMKSLDASYSVTESLAHLRRLEAICGRLTSAAPPVEKAPRAKGA